MTKIFAHRGAHENVAENTIEAFERALILGADGIELDIHYAKDGQIMVYHDFELSRLTNAKGLISDYDSHTLMQLPLWGNTRIPTLKNVLELIKHFQTIRSTPILLNVELKAGHRMYKDIETRTLALCEQYLSREQLIYSSFDHHALVKLKSISDDILIGVLTASSLYEPWEYLSKLKADFYHPNVSTLDSNDIEQLTSRGFRINTYTVNAPDQAQKLIEANIHGIISDFPEKMLSLTPKDI